MTRMIGVMGPEYFSKPFWLPQRMHSVLLERSNFRQSVYLKSLFFARFPEGNIVSVNELDQLEKNNYSLCLLYSDSIGLGCAPLEKRLLKNVAHSQLFALNGRGRLFPLNRSQLLKLRAKRCMEKTMLPELILLPFLLTASILLYARDAARGSL